MDKKEELKKDRECIHCKKFFDCKGKPRNVEKCLNFQEVKRNEKLQ